MSFGKMRTPVTITREIHTTDSEGFTSNTKETIASVRAYREGRHGSEKWANMARFTTATDLFRIRVIPDVDITTDMIIECDDHEFQITSVEDVTGRGMYLEILAEEVTESGGS